VQPTPIETFHSYVVFYVQGDHSPGKPGKPGKVRELDSGQGKVRENGKSQGKVRESYNHHLAAVREKDITTF